MLKIRLELFLIIFLAACVVLFFQCQIFQISQDLNNLRNENYKILNSNAKTVDVNNNDDAVIIYNRVPKTGSTSFIGVAYDLCKKNNFHVIHVNVSSNNHVLSLSNQYKLVQNITKWDDMKPAIYHGHFAYLDFSKYSSVKPMYINIIRKPLDRLVSYYYFLRYGDNFRPYLIRKKHGDTMVFMFIIFINRVSVGQNQNHNFSIKSKISVKYIQKISTCREANSILDNYFICKCYKK